MRQGQILGEVGCTGSCSGTHLHLEVFQSNQRQNPMRYLP
ncbi:MAG TPA: M23 family metallopeptidase [Dehalococcoidia bacterium]|nr:M23 family metallopeptidase [Dehalococcoidia bacterium]